MNAKRRVKLRRDPVMDKAHRSEYITRALITAIIEGPSRRPILEIQEEFKFALDSLTISIDRSKFHDTDIGDSYR